MLELMSIPLMLASVYTSALIFGPAFLIVLAVCLGLTIRFPNRMVWISLAMMVAGFIEVSSVSLQTFWVYLIAFSTAIFGVILFTNSLLSKRDRLGAVFLTKQEGFTVALFTIIVGVLGILLSVASNYYLGYTLGLGVMIFGVCGICTLLPENTRAKTGLTVLTVGFSVIVVAVFMGFIGLAFFVGIVTVFIGVSIVVSGLPFWVQNHSGGKLIHRLKRILYVSLIIFIFSSASVFSLRKTNVLREDINVAWTYATVAGTTIHGSITSISLNCEVNCYGMYYHIFPALITVNVTEIVKVGESWVNLTEISSSWINKNMIVAYDKPNVPSLIVGQHVEVSGYYDFPVEDELPYSNKLIIAMKIDESYVKALQG